MSADFAADIENYRTGQTEVREEQAAAGAVQGLIPFQDTDGNIRQRDAAQPGDPLCGHSHWDKRRSRWDNGMTEPGRDIVAVAGGAAAGVGTAAGGEDDSRGRECPLCCCDGESTVGPSQIAQRLFERQSCPTGSQS